ncbi:helix-turn-helix domain-containing protein [Desertivirga arenae]|uniref:helix-turn-helix domain-containing protein n=1 Tax=Desertivirga arenae TaxID=2810309 RepID=UPI001A9728FA|nr:helix-turn-helix domain-containing protein [Pedobacter sp. SYSU D00823]
MEFTSIIVAVGVIQGFILSIALFRNRIKAGISNTLLALCCLLFALVTFEDFLMRTHLILQLPHLFAVFYPFIFALGPVFFLYVQSLTAPAFRLKPALVVHFIPYLLLLLLFIFNIYFNNSEVKIQWIKESFSDSEPNLFIIIALLQNFVYISISLVLLIRHKKNIRKIFSYDERINLRWLMWLVIGVITLWGLWGLAVFFNTTIFKNLDAIGFPVFVYIIGYWGMGQKVVYNDPGNLPADQLFGETEKTRYSMPAIPEDLVEEKLEILLKYMETDKPYLNGELTILELSTKVQIPVNQLSQLINGKLDQNFFEFVNRYRVNEFKKQVINPDNQHLSLLGIALDCGFNSKASFNAIFKKATGQTPSEYRKKAEMELKTSEFRL